MAKREFVMLAHNYNEAKYSVNMWYASEKLDGQRALWDGGITRGIPTDQVAFANIEKDARLLRRQISTGLWSRYGKVIHAPDWWLDKLPKIPLDGELYIGVQQFQTLCSIVKQHEPGVGWERVKFMIFDSPPIERVFGDGEINNTNFRKRFSGVIATLPKIEMPIPYRYDFEAVYSFLGGRYSENDVFQIHRQEQLPCNTKATQERLEELLFEVTSNGGEGLILRKPTSLWVPERTHQCLKVKRMLDAEGTVTGYTWGRETDKGSKLLGIMGALILDFNGRRLELSGFTDLERELCVEVPSGETQWKEQYAAAARVIGRLHPGEDVLSNISNPKFQRGSKISFRYRELSDGGIPKEARYWRKDVTD